MHSYDVIEICSHPDDSKVLLEFFLVVLNVKLSIELVSNCLKNQHPVKM